MLLIPLRFPDGHLVSNRSRRVEVACYLTMGTLAFTEMARPGRLLFEDQVLPVDGRRAYWSRAWDEVRQLAELAQLPVFVNGMARGLLPSAHANLYGLTRDLSRRGFGSDGPGRGRLHPAGGRRVPASPPSHPGSVQPSRADVWVRGS